MLSAERFWIVCFTCSVLHALDKTTMAASDSESQQIDAWLGASQDFANMRDGKPNEATFLGPATMAVDSTRRLLYVYDYDYHSHTIAHIRQIQLSHGLVL